MSYSEEDMIEHMVFRYYSHLLTRVEGEVTEIFTARRKDEYSKRGGIEQRLRLMRGNLDDQHMNAILARGPENFYRDTAERVMRERGQEVVLNRCPKCNRIVRTPKARQCMWCLHDWY